MIFLGETSDPAREIAFHLPDATNPLVGITGHSFSTGEVKIRLPGGAYVDADVTRVVEKGFGDYALQLTDAQVATKGKVYLYVNVAGAQIWTSDEEIVYKVDLAGSVGGTPPASGALTWQSLIDRIRLYLDDDHAAEDHFIDDDRLMLLLQVEYAQLYRRWLRAGLINVAPVDQAFAGNTITLSSALAIVGAAEDLGNTLRPLNPTQSRFGRAPFWTGTDDVGKSQWWEATGFAAQITVKLHPADAGGSYLVRYIAQPGYATDTTTTVDLPYGADERLVLGTAKRANIKGSTRSAAIEDLIQEIDAELAFTAAGRADGDAPRVRRLQSAGRYSIGRVGAVFPANPAFWYWP